MKIGTLLLMTAVASASVFAAKPNVNTRPYPYGNPVITHMYTADAAPKVMPDGRVWMVTSVDDMERPGYSNMHAVHAFSSVDMRHWEDHGTLISLDDLGEPEGEDWAIWAPDIVYRNGTYYLYFPMRNKLKDGSTDRYVVVAESDSMDKRFKVTNPRMKGVERSGLDPAVFVDDDGQAYLYWNQMLMGRLDSYMREIDGKMFKLDIGAKNFMEASWMHKHNGKYYFNYHTKYNGKVDPDNPDDPARKKSHLDYSMGDSPCGPLKYMGTVNYELGVGVENGPKLPDRNYVPWRLTQSNHGAMLDYHGHSYFFYHTSALSSWLQDGFKGPGTWTQRSVCVDEMHYNPDGSIQPIQQTVEGVAALTINQPFEIRLGKAGAAYTDNACFEDIDLGSGYYYFDVKLEKTAPGGRIEIRRDAPDGLLIGTLLAEERNLHLNGGISDTFLREAHGIHDLYLIVQGHVAFSAPRVFAGCPR